MFCFCARGLLQISRHIVTCLNPFRRPDCKAGRISNTDDFKHLARKVGSIPSYLEKEFLLPLYVKRQALLPLYVER